MTRLIKAALVAFVILVFAGPARAHFGMIIPTDDIVEMDESREVGVELMFHHPFEGLPMNLARPEKFGVDLGGKKTDLLPTLREIKATKYTRWKTTYKLRRPGDYIFYMEPRPYFEPEEDCYIIHYTKVLVSAFGKEEGWDRPLGLKTEIVPLTRPYGLYAGNSFTGRVLLDGKPAAGCEVEVELYNKGGERKAPAGPFITQVVKTDENGVFTYTAPFPGWWGFAGLNTADHKIKGKDVELGAVLWVKFH